jgi:hypothetical protein
MCPQEASAGVSFMHGAAIHRRAIADNTSSNGHEHSCALMFE